MPLPQPIMIFKHRIIIDYSRDISLISFKRDVKREVVLTSTSHGNLQLCDVFCRTDDPLIKEHLAKQTLHRHRKEVWVCDVIRVLI